MRKRLLLLYFLSHLSLIFFQSLESTINGYWRYHYDEAPSVPILSDLKNNSSIQLYHMLSGTDTGYGFYGIKTATVKYLRVKYLDSEDREVQSDRFFKLTSSNGISRFGGYSSYLANYIAETEKMVESDSAFLSSSSEILRFRESYIEKIFKWLGKKDAESTPGCVAYSIELLTIVPSDIWKRENKSKPELYVIKKGLFPVK